MIAKLAFEKSDIPDDPVEARRFLHAQIDLLFDIADDASNKSVSDFNAVRSHSYPSDPFAKTITLCLEFVGDGRYHARPSGGAQ